MKMKLFLCVSVNDCEGRESMAQTGISVKFMQQSKDLQKVGHQEVFQLSFLNDFCELY